MGPFDMKPMITAATAGAEATDRLAAAIVRLAKAQEQANDIALNSMSPAARIIAKGRLS